jgi:site-specific DNA-methyltransferase (adenine-specific)
MAKIKFKDIKPDSRNTNKHTEYGMHTLDNSLEQVGIIESVTISNDNVIISGNARHEKIGQKFTNDAIIVETDGTTPVVIKRTDIESGTKEFHKASILANTVAQKNQNIDVELVEVLADEFEFEVSEVFVDVEVDEVLEATEDDFDATPPKEAITVLGDLYEIGEHRLLCGDSTDSDQVAKLMNGQKADMVFTDPPYGMKLDTNYSKMPSTKKEGNKIYDTIKGDNDDFSNELINTIFACFDDCKEIFIWGADYFAELLPNKNEGSWVVWDKRVDDKFDKMIGSAFELCWSKSKHQRRIARINNTLFSGEQDAKNKVHPTQKPIKLVTFFFDNWGNKSDLIADLYLGSGTTMVASHQLKRKCYGMELDPKYCDVIVKRMIKLDPTLVIKRNGVLIDKKEFDDN